MAHSDRVPNRIKQYRVLRGWSQEELARRAGVSRAEVSAIEIQRVVPSVAAALTLAAALDCRVEDLFGSQPVVENGVQWAWESERDVCRFWQAEVDGRILRFPVEATASGTIPHDGISRSGKTSPSGDASPERTIIMASCDPAAGLLAAEIARTTDYRLIVIPRSSGAALELLKARRIHVAGIHLAGSANDESNAAIVRERLGPGYRLLRGARWTEGIAVGPGIETPSVRSLLREKVRWIGRETGSGARQCLDDLFEGRAAPKRVARDHRGVVDAIRCGWGDVGVCLQLASEEGGLRFLKVRDEAYDLCVAAAFESDLRWRALLGVVRSPEYRQLLGELPGYDSDVTGEIDSTG